MLQAESEAAMKAEAIKEVKVDSAILLKKETRKNPDATSRKNVSCHMKDSFIPNIFLIFGLDVERRSKYFLFILITEPSSNLMEKAEDSCEGRCGDGIS